VMCAATVYATDGMVTHARVAVGAASAVAQRIEPLEHALIGARVDGRLGEIAAARHFSALHPIDDVRSDASYRIDAAVTLTRRALNALGANR
jgi:CO/xanthine dehydrogenase FAD-binding subunit